MKKTTSTEICRPSRSKRFQTTDTDYCCCCCYCCCWTAVCCLYNICNNIVAMSSARLWWASKFNWVNVNGWTDGCLSWMDGDCCFFFCLFILYGINIETCGRDNNSNNHMMFFFLLKFYTHKMKCLYQNVCECVCEYLFVWYFKGRMKRKSLNVACSR